MKFIDNNQEDAAKTCEEININSFSFGLQKATGYHLILLLLQYEPDDIWLVKANMSRL